MPTYQYACTDCGDRTEVVQKFTDDSLSVCATCGGRLRKVFSPVGIVFKGSGFYRTDSRAGSATDGKPAMEKAVNGSPAAGDSGAAAKSGSGAAASDKSAGDKPAGDKPAGDKSGQAASSSSSGSSSAASSSGSKVA
ncbi:MAG TPA: FmdB family transcriptional regulator [Actinobacteria bacterium]|nr:FmdB family transcriptional regulator [Actinomycetota bacterium]